jgi:hypothetical protein
MRKTFLVVLATSFLMCGCSLNPKDVSSGDTSSSIPLGPIYDFENNWNSMIKDFGLFVSDISFEMEFVREGSRFILKKDDNRFASYFYGGDEDDGKPQYFTYRKDSKQGQNVYEWTTYGDKGETFTYALDEFVAEFTYPFGFDKNDLTYDPNSKSYKASEASYEFLSGDYSFDYRNVEMKFNGGTLTSISLECKDKSSASIDQPQEAVYISSATTFKNFGTTSVTIPQ